MLSAIILLPLVGFLINGGWYLFGQSAPGAKKAGATVVGAIGTLAVAGSFFAAVTVFLQLQALPPEARVLEETLFRWIHVGDFSLDFTLRVDALNALFLLVITGVGSLIHVYSIGYMGHDETPGKFFAYLNLFCFSMLVLVMGGSLPIVFMGWEGVGLCSYLLIGYWYSDMEKASAGKKAFVVNRIGDFGVLLGMFLIYTTFGTLDFVALKAVVTPEAAGATVTAICLLLFLGCTGKSAQIPLYVWLPDAMAGPTPVSALIHAATMVTSGIYLIARLSFLYALSPAALEVVAWIGALTAFLAATIAIVQTDIKKVLAYSTVSQLGYMFLGCGVGAYGAGVFHVITHAFFKALLFLGAGSVIHGMHEEQNILKMGGLKKKMPRTFGVFAIAWLAICGVPPFSGFMSKDEILWLAFSSEHGSPALWGLGALTAVMTAFYMTRLFSLTFLGAPRFKEDAKHHVHESPAVMVYPLIVLAILSAVGGAIGVPHMSWLHHWLEPLMPHEQVRPGVEAYLEWVLMAVSVAGALLGILVGLKLYGRMETADALKKQWASMHRVLMNKWFVDELYEALFVKPVHGLSQLFWKVFDVGVIDRAVLGLGVISERAGQSMRVMQTGSMQVYAVMVVFGLAATLGFLLYGNL